MQAFQAKDLLSQLGEGCLRQLAKRPEGGCQAKDRKGKRIKGAAPKRPDQRGRFWAGGWLLSFSHESAPIVGLTLHPTKKRAPLPTVEVSLSHVVHYSPRNKPINGFTAGKALPNHGGRNIRGFGVDPHKRVSPFWASRFVTSS